MHHVGCALYPVPSMPCYSLHHHIGGCREMSLRKKSGWRSENEELWGGFSVAQNHSFTRTLTQEPGVMSETAQPPSSFYLIMCMRPALLQTKDLKEEATCGLHLNTNMWCQRYFSKWDTQGELIRSCRQTTTVQRTVACRGMGSVLPEPWSYLDSGLKRVHHHVAIETCSLISRQDAVLSKPDVTALLE